MSVTDQNESSQQMKSHHIALGALGAVVASYTVFKAIRHFTKTKLTIPGGHSGLPYVGDFSRLQSDFRAVAQEMYEKYGEIFYVYAMGESLVVLATPETLEWFETQERQGGILKESDIILGSQGIINQSGAPHKASRRMFLKSVGAANLPAMFPFIDSCVRTCIDECLNKAHLDDFLLQSKSLAWKIGTTLLFGDLITQETSNEILRLCHEMLAVVQGSVLPAFIPGTAKYISSKKREQMVAIFENVLRQRIENYDVSSGFFVDRLLDEHVKKYNTTEIDARQMGYMTDQIMVFVLGSHETTASTITNVMVELDAHPELKAKVRQMYDDCNGELTFEMIKSSEFLSSFLTECMRVHSISGISKRTAAKDLTYKGYTIPEGTPILPGLSVINHDIAGRKFDVSRVRDGAPSPKNKDQKVFPFGIGMHHCVGQNLARLEMSVTMLRICGECDWEIEGVPKKGLFGIIHHNFASSFRRRKC